jgi:hypothetical protein
VGAVDALGPDPRTQADIIDGCWTGDLDPTHAQDKRESGDLTNSRIIIYAVRPFHWKEAFPKVNQFESAELVRVCAKWMRELPYLRADGDARPSD